MKNENIIKDIRHFENVCKNKYEILARVIKKGYSDSEIVNTFNDYLFKWRFNGSPIGIILILLAVLLFVFIKSTFGSFDYEFESAGDFFRLNEWVLKPFLSLASLMIGINLVIRRELIDKNTKVLMIIMFSFFVVSSFIAQSWLSILFGTIGIISFASINSIKLSNLNDSDLITSWIKNRTNDEKLILKKILNREWNSSSIILFLLLATILFLNSPIRIIEQADTDVASIRHLKIIDYILVYGLKTLFYSTFIISILININLYKFKYFLIGLTILSFIFFLISVFQVNFQKAIIPALIVFISGIITILRRNLIIAKRT